MLNPFRRCAASNRAIPIFLPVCLMRTTRSYCILLTAAFSVMSGVHADDNTIEESFLNSQFNRMQFGVVGDSTLVNPAADGLRIKATKPIAHNVGLRIPHVVHGSFEYSVEVDIRDADPPTGGYGTGVALLIENGISHGASLQLVRVPEGATTIVAHHFEIVDGEHKHEAKTFNVEKNSYVLKLQRQGKSLHYLISDDRGITFTKRHTIDFVDSPLPVTQVYAQAGGAENLFDVTLRALNLTADELVRPGQRVAKNNSSKIATIIIVSVLGLLTAVVVGVIVVRGRASGPEEA
ncbi:MAG: hypothetical protein Fues2KO_22780 [Fuerstiella sp.]